MTDSSLFLETTIRTDARNQLARMVPDCWHASQRPRTEKSGPPSAASDPFSLTAHDALELATIRGAEAINKADIIGSLEPGKQADIVVHSTAGPQFLPRSTDPVLQLIWASDGRSVSEVLIAGRLVVTGGQCRTVELDDLREQARACRDRLLATRG